MKKNPKKNRWSDYEPAPSSNVRPLNNSEDSLKVTLYAQGDRPLGIDFSFMKDRPQIASLFAKTMRVAGEEYARATSRGISHAVHVFYRFVELRRPDVNDTSAMNHELFQEMVVWMTQVQKTSMLSAATRLTHLRSLLRAAKSLYPDAFQPDFEIPIYVIPNSSRLRKNTRAVGDDILQKLLSAAEKEADEIRKQYREGDVPDGPGALIPFMILIGVKTAINPESLYNIGRDCLKPHIIDAAAFYVVWTKRRSKAGIQRQLHYVDPRGNGVIELIRFLLAYTGPLVDQAPKSDRGLLFLYRYQRFNHRPEAVCARRPEKNNRALREFCRRHGLPDVKLSQLRPSAATYYYKKTGGKLRKVQLLLGHVSISTTVRYIGDPLVQRLHDESIRTAQTALVERAATVIPKEAKQALGDLAEEIPQDRLEKIADGAYDTGLCKCRNPFDSPQPGQQKGKCCTLFLACLTCPNALFFLEDLPRAIALLNHFRMERENMRRGVWEALYQDKIKIIEDDIIGAFGEAQIAEATVRAAEMSDIPALMAKEVLR